MQDQASNQLASRLEAFMARYGYQPIETPIIQPAELFLTKAGDQIINRLFTFERLGRQLALRPEFTAQAAHTYVARYPGDQSPVVRWQYGGPVFDDEQRFSIGAELIGLGGAAADAEIIALAANGATAQGLDHWHLVVGHVELMRLLLGRFKLDNRTQRFLLNHLHHGKAHVLEQLDRLLLGRDVGETLPDADPGSELGTQQMLDVLLDATQRGVTMGSRTRADIVRRLVQKRQRATERGQIVAALDFLEIWNAISDTPERAFQQIEALLLPNETEARKVFEQWREVIALLDAYGIPAERIRIHPGLARSWDYYTGIVFELWSNDSFHVGGGGRYDELTRLVGGQTAVPAVGFAYYADQLLTALPDTVPTERPIVTIAASSASRASAIRWAQMLRQQGYAVILVESDDLAQFTTLPDGSLRRDGQTYTSLDMLLTALETTR